MLSLRGRFCRFLTKHLIAPKFDPKKCVDEIRESMESLAKYAKLPTNIIVEKFDLNGIAAEWIYTDAMRGNKAVLFLHGGGYNICSPNTHREIAVHIALSSGARVLLISGSTQLAVSGLYFGVIIFAVAMLTDFFGNYTVAVALLAVGFGGCTWIIGKLWASGDRVVAFEREPDPSGSSS